ncbi:2-succinyl-6-hydroxy-2,4-cyclohexadiene-1-carboxylate synthase [Romeria aff. gracilis LEGE 07310]|uniref:Putative 2-succinyl-6-hydroxy-2,4-cyclohexadiene-1-carboxylate synthase n=1 Tax=Vasconcelosia minhoensis LEGE 07310 TaxID=915328 RepID=A0A8J7AX92_9CYAN|nr:2-succinyl-6-hydroxy-2,4-cyclohexadiene-1-carboxylate synthase [Romeria gracilis]MBE9077697.1 2-succinyl-6-hydroxy-2,4-cyclohexadiene-1-carboxylate synthase [Romeria aff. gracilis LEGE 07310]
MIRQLLAVGDYRFSYWAVGNPQHPPILFLHGFMGSGQDFAQVMTAIADRFYCVAVDLPGHGYTQVLGKPASYGMEPTAAGLIQLITALDLRPCRLVGYSMGGRLGLYLLLQFPEYFCAAVLESASPGLQTAVEREERVRRDRALAQQLETQDFRNFLTDWYNNSLFTSLKSSPSFASMFKRRLQNNPRELAQSIRHFSTGCQPSLWHRLSQNQVPLLLLVGSLDSKFVNLNSQMAELSGLAQLRIVADDSHNIHLAAPERFVSEVKRFFTGT